MGDGFWESANDSVTIHTALDRKKLHGMRRLWEYLQLVDPRPSCSKCSSRQG